MKKVFYFTNKFKDPLNKFFLESNKQTRIAISISAIGLLLFVVTAVLSPFKDQLFNLLYPKPTSEAQEKPAVLFVRNEFMDSKGAVATIDKQIAISGKSEVLINGERLSDIASTENPIIVDERQEGNDLRKYIMQLSEKSVSEVKTGHVAQKNLVAQQHQQVKTELERLLGKKLTNKIPGKDQRRVLREFDTSFNGLVVELLPTEVDQVKGLKEVKNVTEDGQVKATLNESIPMIKADQAWPFIDSKGAPLTGFGVKIGIIDTGIDYTHADLGGCFGAGCKVEGGWDFVNNDPNPMDDHGHGTHVAATAAGGGVASDGTKLFGVAPDATLYAYKVLNYGGSGSFSNVIAAIDRCIDPNQDGNISDHLDVCSMSLGGSGNPDDPPSIASDNAMASGVVITVAAGNSGPSSGTIGSPGTSRESITVGAVCKTGDTGTYCTSGPIASFSSRGPVTWTDSLGNTQTITKPDIVAPGVRICAAEWDNTFSSSKCKDDKHVAISGTSMATPHVAGMAALLHQAVPNATTLDIKNAIKAGATAYDSFDENTQGKGLIDTIQALKILSPNLDFSSKLYTTPFSWYLKADITNNTFSATQSFTVTNTTTADTTATISTQNVPAGLTLTTDISTISIPASGTASFTATLQGDNSILVSGQAYQAQIVITSPIKTIYSPVSVNVPNRITVSQNVDFGLDLPDLAGVWTSTKTAQLTNLQSVSNSYSLSTDCCYNSLGTKVTNGIGVTVPSSLTLSPNQTASFDTIMSIDNSTVPNGIYSGLIIISSGVQLPVRIPFTVTKFYKLEVTFPAGQRAAQVEIQDQNSLYARASSVTTTSFIFLLGSKPSVLDIVGMYWILDSTGERIEGQTFVTKEDLAFGGNDTVFLDPASATVTYTPVYTDPDGKTLTGFAYQGASLRFKSNGFPPTDWGFIGFPTLIFKFSPTSGDYVFSLIAATTVTAATETQVGRAVHYQYDIPDGITASKTLTNSPGDLKLVPVFGYPFNSGDTSARFNLFNCIKRYNQFMYGSCISSGNTPNMFKTNDYRLDLFVLPTSNVFNYVFATTFQEPVLNFNTGSEFTGPEMIFDANGIIRWVQKQLVWSANMTPPNILPSPDKWRIDIGSMPYEFNVKWNITPAYQEVSRRLPTFLAVTQEWDWLRTDITYRVYRDGVEIASGVQPAHTYGIGLSSIIQGIGGTYDVELIKTATINGVLTSYNYKGTFTLPSNFNRGDKQPPTTTSFGFLSGGAPVQVLDPTKTSEIRFTLDPEPYGSGTDSITQASVQMKSDIANWQTLPIIQDVSTGEYTTTISPQNGGATLYTFDLFAQDKNSNVLHYTFQVPAGPSFAPSPTLSPTPSPTSSPSPTSPPVQNYGSITGTVYSSAGGTVPGVKISITAGGRPKKTYYTNSLGVYSITNLAPATYSLTFQAKGYVNLQTTASVTANTTTVKDVTMIKR